MILKNLTIFFVVLYFLTACSEAPELIQNNNPDKYSVARDVLWASPDGFDLTMDIYTPSSGKDSYPVIIIYHGGGWLINNKSIMDQMSAYLATNSEYVVANVNYRLLGDNDNSVTLNQIIDDALGAVVWVKHNIEPFKGDPSRVIVTGDSAGGHLSASVVNMGGNISSDNNFPSSLKFTPSYLPPGTTAEQIAASGGMQVQAAILSYGAFDVYQGSRNGFESWTNPFWLFSGSLARGIFGDGYNVDDHADMYQAASPVYHIPASDNRSLPPQLLTAGSADGLVTPESVQQYQRDLQAAGHHAEYWEYQDRGHAFLDSGSNAVLGSSFEDDAPVALDVMIAFLNGIFYPAL